MHSRILVSATLVESARQALDSLATDRYEVEDIRELVKDIALELRYALSDAGVPQGDVTIDQ